MFQSYESQSIQSWRLKLSPAGLGVPANVRNSKLLVRTVHTYTYHPCKNERLAMASVAILCQNWG